MKTKTKFAISLYKVKKVMILFLCVLCPYSRSPLRSDGFNAISPTDWEPKSSAAIFVRWQQVLMRRISERFEHNPLRSLQYSELLHE